MNRYYLFFSVALFAVCLHQPASAQMGGRGGLKNADANGDGMISESEFLAVSKTRFQSMDANHDGQLSIDELKALRGKFKKGGGFGGSGGGGGGAKEELFP